MEMEINFNTGKILKTELEKAEKARKDAELKAIKEAGLLTKSEKISMSTKDISKAIRGKLKDKFPYCKFSVRTEVYSGGSSITISLMESDIRIYRTYEELSEDTIHKYKDNGRRTEEEIKRICKERDYNQLNHNIEKEYNPEQWCNGVFLTKAGHHLFYEVMQIINYYNYDNSDVQTDYFDVNFYTHLEIGRYDKPYKRIEPKPTTKKEQITIKGDYEIKTNEEKKGYEVYFKSIPKVETRDKLKSKGFRWSRFNKCWYIKQNKTTQEEIENLI